MENEDHRQDQTQRMADFFEEIQRAKTKAKALGVGAKFAAIAKEEGLDPDYFTGFSEIEAEAKENPPAPSIPLPAYIRTHAAPAMDSHVRRHERPHIPVEREGDSIQQRRGEEWIHFPKALDEARFDTRQKLCRQGINEIIKYSDQEIIKEVPENFAFSYEEEMVLLGFFNLLSASSYNHHIVDKGRGYFPGSVGKTIYFLPIGKSSDLYKAIGLPERGHGLFKDAQKVKEAFKSILQYQHPVLFKQDSGQKNEDGKTIYNAIVSYEPLFRLFRYGQLTDEWSFQEKPISAIKTLKQSVILLNPTFFPEGMVKRCYRLESGFYPRVESARMKLSAGTGGNRGWSREPAFLTFGNYIAHQGGHYATKNGRMSYVFEREVSRLLSKLGINADDRNVLERVLKIYTEMGYLEGYEFLSTKDGQEKLQLKVNIEKFPHLQLPSYRFLQRTA
jgi:hypothetical protein